MKGARASWSVHLKQLMDPMQFQKELACFPWSSGTQFSGGFCCSLEWAHGRGPGLDYAHADSVVTGLVEFVVLELWKRKWHKRCLVCFDEGWRAKLIEFRETPPWKTSGGFEMKIAELCWPTWIFWQHWLWYLSRPVLGNRRLVLICSDFSPSYAAGSSQYWWWGNRGLVLGFWNVKLDQVFHWSSLTSVWNQWVRSFESMRYDIFGVDDNQLYISTLGVRPQSMETLNVWMGVKVQIYSLWPRMQDIE